MRICVGTQTSICASVGGGERPEDGAVICRVDAYESSCCGALRFEADTRRGENIAVAVNAGLLTFREILDEAVAVCACSEADVSERAEAEGSTCGERGREGGEGGGDKK